MSELKTTLGIDLGTQSIKVLFYDFENRKIVCSESSELKIDQDASGKAEQDAQWWIDGLCSSLDKIPRAIKASATAISVSGQQHGFVALDKNGNVLAPVKLWCDTSTQVECDEIMDKLGGEANCIELYGNKILVGFTASKILSLKRNHRELYQQLDTILLPHDYINYWLTGERSMEYGDASGTGFLNIYTRRWSKDVLCAIDSERDLSLCLPNLSEGNSFVGSLNNTAANLTGLPKETPVAAGGGDNMMAAIGTGNLTPGRTTISLGTSGTVYAYADNPIVDSNGNVSAFCSSTGGWMPLLCTMNCTVTTEILRDLLNIKLEHFENYIESVPIGAQNVLTLPFFNGERTPNLPNARGCILGLDSSNATPNNLLRSGVEGASFALRFGLDELNRLGVTTNELVLTGGGAKSAVWRQMIADIMNIPVMVLQNNEGAAFGAALQAYTASENRECDTEFLSSHYEFSQELSCQPIESNVDAYEKSYQRYLDAVKKISGFYST